MTAKPHFRSPEGRKLNRCRCGAPDCTATTGKTFAPGHDAKLVSRLANKLVEARGGLSLEDVVRELRQHGGTYSLELKLEKAVRCALRRVNRTYRTKLGGLRQNSVCRVVVGDSAGFEGRLSGVTSDNAFLIPEGGTVHDGRGFSIEVVVQVG